MADKKNLILLSILTFALLLPFINKAISSDGIFYISVARQIIKNPIKPFHFNIECAGEIRPAWILANNPPGGSFLMAIPMLIFGENEFSLHLWIFLFALFSVIGMYFLSKQLGINPFYSALLLLVSPCFFVNATDVLLDIMLLAFCVNGMSLILYGESSNRKLYLFSGWIILSMALLIKFVSVVYIGLVIIWLYLNKKKLNSYFYLAIPVIFIFTWCLHNIIVYGEMQLFGRSSDVGISFALVKEIPLLTYIGGGLLFPFTLSYIVINKKKFNLFAYIGIFVLVNLIFNILKFSVLNSLLFGVFISNSILLIYETITLFYHSFFNKKLVPLLLASWFILYLILFGSVSAIIAVRYLVPMLPAVVLLFVYFANENKKLIWISIISSLLLSLALSHSDYVWAGSYRKVSEIVRSKYSNSEVYYTGYLGFQYYMHKNGFKAIMSKNEEYDSNTIFVTTRIPVPQRIPKVVMAKLKKIDTKYIESSNPFKTISPMSNAGFHLNMFGLLPYSVSKYPLERFDIWVLKNEQFSEEKG